MAYTDAVAALKARCAAIEGIRRVLLGQPPTPQNLPLIYIEADSGTRTRGAQVTVAIHRMKANLLVAFQDNVSSEDAIGRFIDVIPEAIDNNSGAAPYIKRMYVTEWQAGYLAFGSGQQEIVTRRVEFTVEAKDEGPRGTV